MMAFLFAPIYAMLYSRLVTERSCLRERHRELESEV